MPDAIGAEAEVPEKLYVQPLWILASVVTWEGGREGGREWVGKEEEGGEGREGVMEGGRKRGGRKGGGREGEGEGGREGGRGGEVHLH